MDTWVLGMYGIQSGMLAGQLTVGWLVGDIRVCCGMCPMVTGRALDVHCLMKLSTEMRINFYLQSASSTTIPLALENSRVVFNLERQNYH